MKRYNQIKEKRMTDFKAWYSLSSDWWYQFSSGLLHNETSLQQLKIDEQTALKKGYVRIYVYDNHVNIQTYSIPDDREFLAVKEKIIDNSFQAKVRFVIWETNVKSFYFRKQSFFFSDSILDGRST